MSFYKPLLEDEDKNFKLKQIVGRQYGARNGSSAAFGSERSTGSFRLWTSFTRGVNSADLVDLGNSQTVKSSLLYNSVNSLIKKYTGSFRSTVSQPTFTCIMFDKNAFGDYVNRPASGTFITSNSNTYVRKTSLSGNELYNATNFVPIVVSSTEVGFLFPREGVFVNFNQSSLRLAGNTVVIWSPINYKQEAYYFRRLGCKQFNFSNNPSFSAASLTRTYITTVGLYGQRDSTGLNPTSSPLLAVAKLITPVKKNDETDVIFKINLEY